MKTLIALLLAACTFSVIADTHVNGYYRSNGTYVAPHYRTEANNTRSDNYSTQGNVNPYTGQPGYKPNDYTPPAQPQLYNYDWNNGIQNNSIWSK